MEAGGRWVFEVSEFREGLLVVEVEREAFSAVGVAAEEEEEGSGGFGGGKGGVFGDEVGGGDEREPRFADAPEAEEGWYWEP